MLDCEKSREKTKPMGSCYWVVLPFTPSFMSAPCWCYPGELLPYFCSAHRLISQSSLYRFPLLQISADLKTLFLQNLIGRPYQDFFALSSLFPSFLFQYSLLLLRSLQFLHKHFYWAFLSCGWNSNHKPPSDTQGQWQKTQCLCRSHSGSDNQITLSRWFISNMVNPCLEASLVFLSQFLAPVFGTLTFTLFQPQGSKWLLK